jgi:acetyltransferase-like isoleucine patch superfamily enzyme
MSEFPCEINGTILSPNITMGQGVEVGSGTRIEADRVVLGDNCFIGENVTIKTKEFWLGDYSRIQRETVGYGQDSLRIGRNCWIGGRCDLDSQGGLFIDDNVGIGSMSQIWSHIRHGDVVDGCRYDSRKTVHIGKDAWFVGSCLVSPVHVGERSMAMLGSVITRDMMPNRTYGGVPAVDITDKVGPQFQDLSVEEKVNRLNLMIVRFEMIHPQLSGFLVASPGLESVDLEDGKTYFDLSSRSYTKKMTLAEVTFLKENGTAKFVPL